MLHEDERRLAGPLLQTVSSDRMGWVSTPTAPRDRTWSAHGAGRAVMK